MKGGEILDQLGRPGDAQSSEGVRKKNATTGKCKFLREKEKPFDGINGFSRFLAISRLSEQVIHLLLALHERTSTVVDQPCSHNAYELSEFFQNERLFVSAASYDGPLLE